MRVGRRHREIARQIQVNTNIVHAQIVIPQRESFLKSLIHLHGNSLGLVLAGEAQEILHDAVGTLRLLVQFFRIFDALRRQLPAGGQQLAISKNGGKRIVQLMGDTRDELTHRGKSFAVKQLFLCPAEVFVSLASFFVEDRTIDRTGNLTADGNEQVHVGWGKLARSARSHDETADHAVLGPENHNVSGGNSFFDLRIAKNRRQREALSGDKGCMRVLDMLQQLRLHGNRGKMARVFGAMAGGRHAPQICAARVKEVKRGGVEAEKLGHLA